MKKIILISCLAFLASCASTKKAHNFEVNKDYVKSGSSVTFKGEKLKLHKGRLKVGDNFLSKVKNIGMDFKFNHKVTIINIVPSIDTPVCDVQTHMLGETTKLDKSIDLVTISRDLPMAQARFAKAAKLENIQYFSDYKYGKFGKKTGLLILGEELLTRGIIVLDKKGVIKYLQIVGEITNLPHMELAFSRANELTKL